jgi:Sulfotransferase family
VTRHLLVVGAQRCGTTSVHALLGQHPEIAVATPPRPEPKVFCDPEASARGAAWYRSSYFGHASPGQLLADKSTSYLEDPEAPGRARAMLGTAHVLAVLRDPLQRAVSNWRFSTRHGLEDRPLEVALRANLDGPREWDRTATSVSPYAYLERGRYAEYLRPWMSTFPATTHVVFVQELVDDEAAVAELWRALEVSPRGGTHGLGEAINRSEGAGPAVSEELCQMVRAYYETSDRELATLLGRSLPW